MERIANDLVEAYKGVYEDQITKDLGDLWEDQMARILWCHGMIVNHTPKERLETYLQWNGIFGYTGRIWDISQGEYTV